MRVSKSLGVDWFLPQRKRPFASTTLATSDLINLLSEEGRCVSEIHDAILYDDEAKAVLKTLMDHGYADLYLEDYPSWPAPKKRDKS